MKHTMFVTEVIDWLKTSQREPFYELAGEMSLPHNRHRRVGFSVVADNDDMIAFLASHADEYVVGNLTVLWDKDDEEDIALGLPTPERWDEIAERYGWTRLPV